MILRIILQDPAYSIPETKWGQVQTWTLAGNLLHLGLAEELDSYAVSDKPQPAGPSAMISYAVPGFT